MHSEYSQAWYKNASIRRKGYIEISKETNLPFFPEELQPICAHEIVAQCGSDMKNYILTQTAYKYLEEVCITENDIVNPTCLSIAYGKAPVNISDFDRADAYSIMADEAFHSYVAKSFILQMQKHTGITPISFPKENEATKAVKKIKQDLPLNMYPDFELVAACITENVFTAEIVELSRFRSVNSSFHDLMVDHARDEGRHAAYFVKIMQCYWQEVSEQKKRILAEVIPKFIALCLDGEHDKLFLWHLLRECGMNEHQVGILIKENTSKTLNSSREARLSNMVGFLKRSGVLSYEPLSREIIELKRDGVYA